ncbi:MAG: condensation domain-containing protein [Candidatus Aminicenantes bacterium]
MRKRDDLDKLMVAASGRTKEKAYWLRKLAGKLVKTAFPYDHRPTQPDNPQPNEITFEFPVEMAAKLIRLSTDSDVRLYILLTAGLIALLHKYTGINDIIVGTPIFKPEKGGNFTNTVLPLRNEIKKNTTFKELLLEVRQTIVEADEHRDYPIEILVQHLRMAISEQNFPLFEVVISVENIHDKSYLKPYDPKMAFNFKRTGECIEGTIGYNSLLYDKNTLERIIAHKVNLLEQVLSGPDLPLSELELVTKKEKEQLLSEFNRKEIQYTTDKTLVEIFARQVEKTPHHYACFENGKYLTYEELNHRANLLAKKIKDI